MRHASIDANEDREAVLDHLARIAAQGSDEFQTVHRAKDGRLWNAEVLVSNPKGGRIFAFIRDVTQQQRLERESEHYRQIVVSSDDGIISKDLQGIVTSWNRAAGAIVGASKIVRDIRERRRTECEFERHRPTNSIATSCASCCAIRGSSSISRSTAASQCARRSNCRVISSSWIPTCPRWTASRRRGPSAGSPTMPQRRSSRSPRIARPASMPA
ncbi:MAG: PAS domain S-box protein [Gammaproteobacteria bacterium]|nr:PAS domain S-box protein [Gammaproteobacteria bacterium]MBI5618459.1 PAS domain S-box protein [Gammaproteobacteria bacterium]